MGYPTRRTPAPFTPVVMFQTETDADRLAFKQIFSLQSDVAETMNTVRSQKQTIGISEIGNPCGKCVARKLSGLYEKPFDPSWKAQVGTFIHAGLEEHFGGKYGHLTDPHLAIYGPEHAATDASPTYHMERRVEVLRHKSLILDGSCDLFVEGASFGLVCDWKTQGASKLAKTAKGDVGETYTVQMHTYGLGYELLGYTVTHVALYALPRDGELAEAKPVLMRYDRSIAVNALARLTSMIDAAETMDAMDPGNGWERLIAAQDRASGCWDCDGYEKAESGNFLRDLTSGS